MNRIDIIGLNGPTGDHYEGGCPSCTNLAPGQTVPTDSKFRCIKCWRTVVSNEVKQDNGLTAKHYELPSVWRNTMNETIWELFKTSAAFNSSLRVGKYMYFGSCVDDHYLDVSNPVCGSPYSKTETRMVKPHRMKLIDRSKYKPHQGRKEMQRRVNREQG